ncbi:unnamed protein product [marine sediment metagenome]|uniref:Uncharacterized protein n=1 Tax=marine sediment metagenome TaxID=412755 RepID=X1I9J4_9ZZZZ
MPIPLAAAEVLDGEFLGIRARLIDVAAASDRIDRAEGSVADDPRLDDIRRSLQILAGEAPDRAEKLQLLFSLPYQENWPADYDL